MVETLFGFRCVAVEPTPDTVAECQKIMKKNGLKFNLIDRALSSRPGTMHLHISERSDASNSLNSGFRKSTRSVPVTVTTIDALSRSSRRR